MTSYPAQHNEYKFQLLKSGQIYFLESRHLHAERLEQLWHQQSYTRIPAANYSVSERFRETLLDDARSGDYRIFNVSNEVRAVLTLNSGPDQTFPADEMVEHQYGGKIITLSDNHKRMESLTCRLFYLIGKCHRHSIKLELLHCRIVF